MYRALKPWRIFVNWIRIELGSTETGCEATIGINVELLLIPLYMIYSDSQRDAGKSQ
jgi:hypothetical protein